MPRKTPTALLLTSLLLASGCGSVLIRPVAVKCTRPPTPSAWTMEQEPEQTYTQQLRQVLSE